VAKQEDIVIAGSGLAAISTFYHLLKKGVRNPVLILEGKPPLVRAGIGVELLHFHGSYTLALLKRYGVGLISKLLNEDNDDIHAHLTPSVLLATTKLRVDQFRHYQGLSRVLGNDFEILSPDEVKNAWPICNIDGIIAAVNLPNSRLINPSEIENLLLRKSKQFGGTIYHDAEIIKLGRSNSCWNIDTNHGQVICNRIVLAANQRYSKIDAVVGARPLIIPLVQRYFEASIKPTSVMNLPNDGVLGDCDSSFYMSVENGTLRFDCYDSLNIRLNSQVKNIALDENSKQNPTRYSPADFTRFFNRIPLLNGLDSLKTKQREVYATPDALPLAGPIKSTENVWINVGHSYDQLVAIGAGWQVSEWITEGAPNIDMTRLDPRRFGNSESTSLLFRDGLKENSSLMDVHGPQNLATLEPGQISSKYYERLKELGAVFNIDSRKRQPARFDKAKNSHPKFGKNPIESHDLLHKGISDDKVLIQTQKGFRRDDGFRVLGDECRTVAECVGVHDRSSINKIEIKGIHAGAWIDSIFTNLMLRQVGDVCNCFFKTRDNGIQGMYRVYWKDEGIFCLMSQSLSVQSDVDQLEAVRPPNSGIQIKNISDDYGVFSIVGPQSPTFLSLLTGKDMCSETFPWAIARGINIGVHNIDAIRSDSIGEVEYELFHSMSCQDDLYDYIIDRGYHIGLKAVGSMAMDSMRIEKSYRQYPIDINLDHFIDESETLGMETLANMNCLGDFQFEVPSIGPGKYRYITMELMEVQHGVKNVRYMLYDIRDKDVNGYEPIYLGSKVVGRCTSGSYGWRVEKSLALGFVEEQYSAPGTRLEIQLLDERTPAIIVPESPYDPENERRIC